jgi:hypothetical protein
MDARAVEHLLHLNYGANCQQNYMLNSHSTQAKAATGTPADSWRPLSRVDGNFAYMILVVYFNMIQMMYFEFLIV